ncbi:Retrovirus-related Pol polyprotein from type-2 retrotransposable element R2DM [Araneus ventricosus]|uniref:Retrovirus-related Pol polyprotein from type-2 retrotransposable element R2DM n=1 Tax=Araneus ventricosus TaxID=182803 RepID=A0A4Y2T3R0_ARAVE|nr:Retrovirus-related Pol polyprotein from type-2 retrotransposable element R2DM [Araneus ventricosus]
MQRLGCDVFNGESDCYAGHSSVKKRNIKPLSTVGSLENKTADRIWRRLDLLVSIVPKWFRTKIGLGVHTQSQHRAKYEATIQVPKSKTRWSSEELVVMAMKEALLIAQGKTLEINTEILSQFPNRTREAIKGQRRHRKYKDLVAEYVQSNSLSLTSVVTAGPVPAVTPSDNSCSIVPYSLDDLSSDSIKGILVNRPVTRRQKRLATAAVQDAPIPPDPPPIITPTSSESSSDIDPNDLNLTVVREVRTELEAANTSLLDLTVNDSIRLESASIPEVAFSFSEIDSKIIDYIDLLFRSHQSSILSVELREAWEDFRRRPCKETLFIRTCLIFEVLLPDKTPSSKRQVRNAPPREALSRKVRRRIEYSRAQRSFFRNPSRYSNSLLSPTNTSSETNPFDSDFCIFLENVMTLPRDSCENPVFPHNEPDADTTSVVIGYNKFDAISKCFPRNGSAPGPNLSTVGDLRRISKFELAKIFNVFLLCMRVPDRFCKAKTIFLPKIADAINPGDFRPISLTPIPARLFSKILARRLSPTVHLDPEQRGFIESDGISQNTFMLDYVLRHS